MLKGRTARIPLVVVLIGTNVMLLTLSWQTFFLTVTMPDWLRDFTTARKSSPTDSLPDIGLATFHSVSDLRYCGT